MSEVFKILEKYTTDLEMEFLVELEKTGTSDADVSKIFSPKRAKNVANILFANRSDLKKDQYAIDLFSLCSQYYDENTPLNLILGEGALDPEGMCELKSNGPLLYESRY